MTPWYISQCLRMTNLDLLGKWEDKWMMEFHPAKCQVLSVTRKHQPILHNYTLHGVTLQHVKSAKYLGVTLTSDLRWNTHISNITFTANRTLCFLRRNLQIHNEKLKTTAYKTLVRFQVEYASTVWYPHTASQSRKVEMVQRTAARYVTRRWYYRSSVGNMLSHLGWRTLAQRREQARLCMMYKIHHGLVAVNCNHQYITPIMRGTRNVHAAIYYHQPHSTHMYHANSFFPRTLLVWNTLPIQVITAPSVVAFRSRLKGPIAPSRPQ